MSFFISLKNESDKEGGAMPSILDEMRDKGWVSLFMNHWLVFEKPEDMIAYVVNAARKGGFPELRPLAELKVSNSAESGADRDIVAVVRSLLSDSFGPLSPKGPYVYKTLASSWELSAAFDEYCAGLGLPEQVFCENHETSEGFLISLFGAAKINPRHDG